MDGRTAAWPFHRPCSTYYNSASEVTTLRHYTNLFIIIIIIIIIIIRRVITEVEVLELPAVFQLLAYCRSRYCNVTQLEIHCVFATWHQWGVVHCRRDHSRRWQSEWTLVDNVASGTGLHVGRCCNCLHYLLFHSHKTTETTPSLGW